MTVASALPDPTGHFGPYGGVFVPETLIAALRAIGSGIRPRQIRSEFSTPI